MKDLVNTKAVIVKGTSKAGNTYYAVKVWLTESYAYFKVLENADKELVREKYDTELINNSTENV